MEVITVTSQQQNASKFISNFSNLINLSNEYEVGLLKIAHPPIMNVTEANNNLFVKNMENDEMVTLHIPSAFYENTHEALYALYETLSNFKADKSDAMQPFSLQLPTANVDTKALIRSGPRNSTTIDNSKTILELINKKSVFVFDYGSINILNFLDFKMKHLICQILNVTNFDLKPKNQIAFIYSSIVSNSLIDYRVSRLLDTVQLTSSKNQHTLFEVQNPVFHNVSAATFIDISFEIRDVNGEFINFYGDLPTILTLGIRKREK